MTRKLIAAAGLAAIIMAAWLFWPEGEQAGGNRIDADPVERGDITRIVSSVGSVRALNTVEVGSQLSGQVIELFADFNTPVESGDLLARIDPQTFERRVQEADANLAVARANVAIQAASIQRAEANLKAARREFERQTSLVERAASPSRRWTIRRRPISPRLPTWKSRAPSARTPMPRSHSAKRHLKPHASTWNAPRSAPRSTAW